MLLRSLGLWLQAMPSTTLVLFYVISEVFNE